MATAAAAKDLGDANSARGGFVNGTADPSPPTSSTSANGHVPHDSALSVGSSVSTKEEDAMRIRDLEEEVRGLADKTSSASQRFADYENEIRVLQAKLRQEQRKNAATATVAKTDATSDSPVTPAVEKPGLSRWGSFMVRKPSAPTTPNPNGTAISHVGSGAREKELEQKLVTEQTQRIAAEKKAKEVSAEIEELSATLFQQANEMVAAERKENATLKMRLQELETRKSSENEAADRERSKLRDKIHSLEQREMERKKRLERLENANRRIERVRALLVPK